MTPLEELILDCRQALLGTITHNLYRLMVVQEECWKFYFLFYESPSDKDIENIEDFGVEVSAYYYYNLNYKCYAATLSDPKELVKFDMTTLLAFQGLAKEVPLESLDWVLVMEEREIPH